MTAAPEIRASREVAGLLAAGMPKKLTMAAPLLR